MRARRAMGGGREGQVGTHVVAVLEQVDGPAKDLGRAVWRKELVGDARRDDEEEEAARDDDGERGRVLAGAVDWRAGGANEEGRAGRRASEREGEQRARERSANGPRGRAAEEGQSRRSRTHAWTRTRARTTAGLRPCAGRCPCRRPSGTGRRARARPCRRRWRRSLLLPRTRAASSHCRRR